MLAISDGRGFRTRDSRREDESNETSFVEFRVRLTIQKKSRICSDIAQKCDFGAPFFLARSHANSKNQALLDLTIIR